MRVRVTKELALTQELALAITSIPQTTSASEKGRTITHGSLRRSVWKISWPLFLTTIFLSIVDLVHVQMAGLLGAGAQAIIGICDQILLLCIILITSLATAATAVMSKSFGANQGEQTSVVTAATFKVTMIAAALLMSLLLFCSNPLLHAFSGCVSNCDTTLADGKRYLCTAVLYLIPFAIVSSINALFMGAGNARLQLVTLGILASLDILGNYLLIVVGWPVKGLGITGIATASIIANCTAAIVAIVALLRSKFAPSVRSLLDFRSGQELNLLKIGLPPAFQDMAWACSSFVLFWLLALSKHPTEAIAAWTVGQRLEAFALAPLSALSLSALVIVGQNMGARRVERAWKASWGVTALGLGIMILSGITLWMWAPMIANWANPTAEVKPFVVSYLQIVAVGLPFAALETVLSGSLQALDDTRVPMLFGFLCNWVIALPLIYLLSIPLHLDTSGAWMALVAATVLSGVFTVWRFAGRPDWRKADTVSGEKLATTVSLTTDIPESKKPVSRGKVCSEIANPLEPEKQQTNE